MLAAIDGKVVAAVGVGHADLAGEVPNTPATLFEIASLTKQFTGAAAARLAADGKLSLDDPISRFLPMAGVTESAHAITLDHLLRHTSGIPGTNSHGRGEKIEDVLPLFLRGGPRRTPGEHWEYWNQGYAIASEIIARAAGVPYTDYCKQHLFIPAGMRATCFTGDPAPEGMTVAIGRSARGEPRSALEHPYGGYGFQYRGMGGVVTNVWDLWRWDRALHADVPLNSDAKAKLFEPGPGDYGLGWFIRRDDHGRLVHSHGGGVRGFICEMRRYPEQDAVLIVLANRDDAPLRRVVTDLEKILFGEATAQHAAALGVIPDELQAVLTGRYEDDRGRRLIIEADGRTTAARISWSVNGGPPVTHATLHLDAERRIIFDDGADLIPITIEPADAAAARTPVEAVVILNLRFQRVQP